MSTIDFFAPCLICDKKISPVAEWLPYKPGTIAHVACIRDEFATWCWERGLSDRDDESYRSWEMWLAEEAEGAA